MSLSALEVQILDKLPDLHSAMHSRDNEIEYLRLLADIIVEKCVDVSHIGGIDEVDDRRNNLTSSSSNFVIAFINKKVI